MSVMNKCGSLYTFRFNDVNKDEVKIYGQIQKCYYDSRNLESRSELFTFWKLSLNFKMCEIYANEFKAHFLSVIFIIDRTILLKLVLEAKTAVNFGFF